MEFSSWHEAVDHVRDSHDYSSPEELWSPENFGEEIRSLRNRLGFGDELEFLGYRLEGDVLIDEFSDGEVDLSPGMICVLAYYSISDRVARRVTERGDEWVNLWQLPGGGAKETAFKRRTVSRIGSSFAPRVGALESAADALGGRVVEEGRVEVPTLPEIRLMVSISPRRGEFPPNCSVHFQRRAANYLPTDNLTDMGTLLARRLDAAASPEVIRFQ